MQPRRAVVEDEFKNGFVAAAKAFQPLRDNRAARCERFVLRQFGDLAEVAAVFVTARCVQEQISTVRMPSRANCAARSPANAPKRSHGIFQRKFLFPAATSPARYKPD